MKTFITEIIIKIKVKRKKDNKLRINKGIKNIEDKKVKNKSGYRRTHNNSNVSLL